MEKVAQINVNDMPEVIKAQDIASHLQVSLRTVYELLDLSPEAGGIPSFTVSERIKRAWRDEYADWLEKRKNARAVTQANSPRFNKQSN